MDTTPAFTLDHIGVAVPDLDQARDLYARLGFTLTAKSSHKRDLPDGGVERLGTGNYCIMLETGYLELIGITDASLPHESLARRLDRYHGLQLVAIGTDDARAAHARWHTVTDGVEPVVLLGRDVPLADGSGTVPGAFRIVYLQPAAFEEVELFAIEHVTRDALWQPALLDHANGATALRAVTLVSANPSATLDRLSALGLPHDDGAAACLDGGRIEVLDAESARARYPDSPLPDVPCAIAMTVAVRDIAAAANLLSTNGVPASQVNGALRVPAQFAGGVVLELIGA